MAAPIKFEKPVGKDAKTQPAIRVDCRGPRQRMYLELRKIAVKHFDTKQSTLAAMVLEDFVKEHLTYAQNPRSKRVEQLLMNFRNPAMSADKKGKSPGGK